MPAQYLSLFISIVMVFALFILIFLRKTQRYFYISYFVSFLVETIYYIYVLFGEGTGSHDISALLRVFQTLMFGCPLLFETIDELFVRYKIWGISKKVRKVKRLSEETKILMKGESSRGNKDEL
jgi:hypothetical protein